MLHHYKNESIHDFVSCFCATCLKIEDLDATKKLDSFVRALVLEVRLHLELRGPRDFIEEAMFAKCANAVITCVSG